MIFYAINLGILTGLCLLHFILYKALDEEKSQFLILAVCICYGCITILKRLVFGTVVSEYAAQLMSFPLTTAVFILIAVYVAVLMKSSSYNMYSWFFYGTMLVVFAAGTIFYAIYQMFEFFYVGLAVLSLEYLAFSMFYLYRHWHDINHDKKMLLFAIYIMILSFMILAVLTVLDVKQVYWCAIGVFVYIITAETVSIRRVIRRMRPHEQADSRNELTAKEKEIYELMQSGLSPKEIAMQTELSVATVYKYQQNINHKLGH